MERIRNCLKGNMRSQGMYSTKDLSITLMIFIIIIWMVNGLWMKSVFTESFILWGTMDCHCTEELALEFQHRYVYYQQYIYLSETTKNMLDALKDRVTLGIITNGNSKRQHGKIQTLGMERWMDEKNIFVSGDLEFAKPDTRIFLLPQNTLGLKAEEMLYIGDSYEHDMQGAKAAGWNTIWMNRRGHDIPEEDCCADRVVPNEEALVSAAVSDAENQFKIKYNDKKCKALREMPGLTDG